MLVTSLAECSSVEFHKIKSPAASAAIAVLIMLPPRGQLYLNPERQS
jgi:hypothetical protein